MGAFVKSGDSAPKSTDREMATIQEKKGRVGRVTDRQLNLLVDYMSTHSSFAAGRFTGPMGHEKATDQWERLGKMLNEHGPFKTSEQWKKTWRDTRRNVRSKAARINIDARATGNRPVEEELSELERKCLSVIGMEVVVGIPGIEECGHDSQSPPPAAAASIPEPPADVPTEDLGGTTGPSNPPPFGEHLEILVEDLFPPGQPTIEAPRRKNEGDMEKATALIVEAIGNDGKTAAAERLDDAAEQRVAIAARRAAADERLAAAAELRQQQENAAEERRAAVTVRMASAAERRAAAAEAALQAQAPAVAAFVALCESANEWIRRMIE